MTLNLARQVTLLRETVKRLEKWDFKRLRELEASPWTDELHESTSDGAGELIQLEAELLQVFDDNSIQLSVRVYTYAPECTLGAELLATEDGKVDWSGEIHEYVDGAPRTVRT